MINNNLRIFINVAEKGSFTQVANEMFISQPAISRAVKTLEDELNVKLFFRDKRNGLILTDVGKKILQEARQMEDLENRIYQTAYRENNFLGGKVRVASIPILTSVILSKAFYRFRKNYPDVTIELLEGSSQEIRKAVEDHRVDFGFTSAPFGDLDNRTVLYDQILSICNKPFASKKPSSLYEGKEVYILCDAAYETLMEQLKGERINIENSFIVQQPETVLKLVEEGNGIGVISELVLNATPNKLIRHKISPTVRFPIGIVAIDLNDLTPVAAKMLEMVEEACAEYVKRSEEKNSNTSAD